MIRLRVIEDRGGLLWLVTLCELDHHERRRIWVYPLSRCGCCTYEYLLTAPHVPMPHIRILVVELLLD